MNTFFMLWITVGFAQTTTFISGQNTVKLSGTIHLDPPYDSRIPPGSCMLIKVLDTNIMDAPSKEIATKKVTLSASDFNILPITRIDYIMTFPQPPTLRYSLDATINMGWCPHKDDSDWIHEGDYLTTTNYKLKITKVDHDSHYIKDITTYYYGKRPAKVNRAPVNLEEMSACKVNCVNGFCNSLPNGTLECIHVPEPCALPSCAADYAPVCGSNGKTYSNGCILQGDTCPGGIKNDLKKVHDGPCGMQIPFRQSALLTIALLMLIITGLATATWVWSHNRKKSAEDIKKISPVET